MALAYPCGGMPELAQGCYSRLCPSTEGEWEEHDPAVLEGLARRMKDSPQKRQDRAEQSADITTVPSGYVYFGQLIDHDVTKDNRYLHEAIPCVQEISNFRTASLDLECVYGKDPDSVPCIYENDKARLKLGPTLPASGRHGEPIAVSLDDLPRLPDGRAIIVDPRNDENLIVSQMHVLFAKFHNCALELIRQQPKLAPRKEKNLRDAARRFVIWHYQWLVLHDFLPNIVRKNVLHEILKPRSKPRLFPQWYTPKDAPVSMPVEFSVAGFRFGHSMVRDTYDLNGHIGGVKSLEIVHMTFRGGGITSNLPANYVIDWRSFFGSLPKINHAELIDTTISEMMYEIPKQSEFAFRFQASLTGDPARLGAAAKMVPPLPEMTLKRGSKIRLPSGEEMARRFRYKPIDPEELFPDQENFFESDLNGRTPLWYYVLREAEVEPSSEPPQSAATKKQQQKLGTLGSRIVAETLYQLLKADADSIVNHLPRWKPPTFKFGPSGTTWCLSSLQRLARFVDECSDHGIHHS